MVYILTLGKILLFIFYLNALAELALKIGESKLGLKCTNHISTPCQFVIRWLACHPLCLQTHYKLGSQTNSLIT